jgi:type I restriction enzyme S subunit
LLPLPPLAVQKRIVDRIESLFAKLDEAKEKVTEVVESYLVRRATILDFAFSGKLTSKWRTQNNIDNNWSEKTFSEVAVIKSNLVKPGEYQDFPHIAPDNIEKRTGVLLQYNTIAEDKVTSGKHRFYKGQILYSKIRPYLSKVVMVDFDGLCSADMYPIEAKENTRYLWYYMLSDNFLEQASSAGSRSVLPKINQKELSRLLVNTPDIDEQKEVVKILDRLLPYEQKVAENAQVVLEQIDVIKKSILFKAFRGELGTNNPEEESAIKLLKKILVET